MITNSFGLKVLSEICKEDVEVKGNQPKNSKEDEGNDIEGDEVMRSSNANGVIEVSIGLMGTCLMGCDDDMELAVFDKLEKEDCKIGEMELNGANGVADMTSGLIVGGDLCNEVDNEKESSGVIIDNFGLNVLGETCQEEAEIETNELVYELVEMYN